LTSIAASELGKPAAYYSDRVTNPLAGLLPNNAALNGTTIQRSLLLTAFPQYSSLVANNLPVGRNRYDAMQVSMKKHFSNGLNFQVNYMVAKTLEQLQLLNGQDIRAD